MSRLLLFSFLILLFSCKKEISEPSDKSAAFTLLDNKEIGVLIISSKLSIIKFQQQKWFIRKGQISKQEDIESLIGHFEVSDWSFLKGNSFKLYLIGKEY